MDCGLFACFSLVTFFFICSLIRWTSFYLFLTSCIVCSFLLFSIAIAFLSSSLSFLISFSSFLSLFLSYSQLFSAVPSFLFLSLIVFWACSNNDWYLFFWKFTSFNWSFSLDLSDCCSLICFKSAKMHSIVFVLYSVFSKYPIFSPIPDTVLSIYYRHESRFDSVELYRFVISNILSFWFYSNNY